MKCPSCQAETPDDSAFCKSCGAKIWLGKEEARAADPAPPGAPPRPAAPSAPAGPAPPREPETELWKGRFSARAFALEYIGLSLLGIAAPLSLLAERTGKVAYVFLGLFAIHGLSILYRLVKRRYTIRYRLTTERLFFDRGLLRRTKDELELLRVDDTRVEQDFLQRVLNVGDIVVISTDRTHGEVRIVGIEKPVELKEMIRERVRRIRSRTMMVHSI